jgi:hypothetical protein
LCVEAALGRTTVGSLLVTLCCSGLAQTSPDPSELFQKAARIIEANTKALPRFACAETVARSIYVVPDKLKSMGIFDASPNDLPGLEAERRFARSNRVRLEVGVFDGRELFAWPGAKEFKYESFDELAGGGTASSGEFGPFSIAVFLEDADPAAFKFIGFGYVAGSRVAEYDYEVPLESSHFSVATRDGGNVLTGYRGVFLIDVNTGDLRRLTVQFLKPPPNSGVQSGRIVTDYARQKVGETVALLPSSSLLNLLFTGDGTLAVNETNYGSCKLFGAESTLDFGLNTESGADKKTIEEASAKSSIPEGLELVTRIITPIDVKKSYAGDMMEAELIKPILVDGKTLLPKGAKLTGRVIQLEGRHYPEKEATIHIQFERVSFDGTSMPISLGSVGPDVAVLRDQKHIDTSSGVAKVATVRRYGTDDFHWDAHTRWLWVTK